MLVSVPCFHGPRAWCAWPDPGRRQGECGVARRCCSRGPPEKVRTVPPHRRIRDPEAGALRACRLTSYEPHREPRMHCRVAAQRSLSTTVSPGRQRHGRPGCRRNAHLRDQVAESRTVGPVACVDRAASAFRRSSSVSGTLTSAAFETHRPRSSTSVTRSSTPQNCPPPRACDADGLWPRQAHRFETCRFSTGRPPRPAGVSFRVGPEAAAIVGLGWQRPPSRAHRALLRRGRGMRSVGDADIARLGRRGAAATIPSSGRLPLRRHPGEANVRASNREPRREPAGCYRGSGSPELSHDEIIERLHGWDRPARARLRVVGGERQRVPRPALKATPIVLFGRGPERLDPENESRITDAAKRLRRDATLIVIAHKL